MILECLKFDPSSRLSSGRAVDGLESLCDGHGGLLGRLWSAEAGRSSTSEARTSLALSQARWFMGHGDSVDKAASLFESVLSGGSVSAGTVVDIHTSLCVAYGAGDEVDASVGHLFEALEGCEAAGKHPAAVWCSVCRQLASGSVFEALCEAAEVKGTGPSSWSVAVLQHVMSLAVDNKSEEVCTAMLDSMCRRASEETVAAAVENGRVLYFAADHGHLSVCKRVVGLGCDINATWDHTLQTALWTAAFNGDTETVVGLLGLGADVNLADATGTSPLFVACYYGFTAVVDLFASYDAKIDMNRQSDLMAAFEEQCHK